MDDKLVRAISEDELNDVVGGMGGVENLAGEGAFLDEATSSRIAFACRNCGEIFYIKAGAPKAVCPSCKKEYSIKG